MRSRRNLLLIASLALVVVVAACGDDEPPEPIEFGEGSVPRTMPSSVPVPSGAAIGSTLIDRVSNRTEMAVTARLDYLDLVQYYSIELVGNGFLLDESAGDENSWRISFSNGDLIGEVAIVPGDTGLSRAVVIVNRS